MTMQISVYPFGVAKSCTSFGWGKGGNVMSAGWQVTLCDTIRRVSSGGLVYQIRCATYFALTDFTATTVIGEFA